MAVAVALGVPARGLESTLGLVDASEKPDSALPVSNRNNPIWGRYWSTARRTRLGGRQRPRVTFTWKDYSDGSRIKLMTLAPGEFICRFLLHVLPEGFQRIRHYGFLANGLGRTRALQLART